MRMGTQDKIITLKMVLSIAISFLMVSLAAIGIFYFRASYIINAEETGDTIPTTGVLPTDWAQKIINYNSNDEYESLSSFSKPIIFGATFADSDVTKTSIDLGNGVYFKTLQNSSLWEDGSTSSNPKSANAYITGCNYLPEDCSNLFRGLTNVPCIQFSGVSTKYTTDMSYMFYNCSSLQSSYDISYSSIYETTYFNPESFDTSRVTDMSGMFAGCSSLTNLNFNTSSFNTSKVKSMYYMFNECVSLTALDLKSFDTSAVESMGYMFGSCVALSNLNLTSFDTSNVKYMHNMFSYCKALESINISSFNTGNVSNMSNMFLQCSSLKSIDLSNFNTQKVTTMDSMFSYSGLRSLDLNHFNTSAVTTMASMFESSKLTHINLKDWDTSNVKNMSRMFYCMSNVGLDLTGWNTSSVTNMASMFAGNYGIQKICVGDGWTTSAVTNSSYMFEGCNNLKGEMGTQHTSSSPSDKTHAFIDRAGAHGYFSNAYKLATGAYINSKIPTDAVRFYFADKNSSIQHLLTSESTPIAVDSSGNITDDIELYKGSDNGVPICVIISAGGITFNEDCSQMFKGLSNLTSIDLSYVINGLCNTTNISEMFSGCSALTTLSTASFATNNITNMSGLFKDCTSLTSLDVSNFITNKTTDMSYMFDGLSQFTEINISNFNTENVTNMSHMFNGCSGLTAIDVRNFVTDKVENFSYMFAGLKKVEEINTSNFITDSATNMAGMFKNCEKVYFFNISQFNTENVADMSYMFYECLQVTTIPVENFNMSNVLDISHMFHSSWQISELNVSGWDASKIENMSYAFANIHIDLTTIDMRTWNATNVKYMDGMFFHTDGIKILDFSSFDIANLISATDMVDCYNIQHIYMPYCSVEKEITFCTLPGTWTSFQTGTTYTDLAITYDYLSYYDDTTFVESHFVQGSSINVFLNNYWVNCLDLASAETIQSILFLETKNATMLDDEYTYLMTSSWIDRWQSIYPMGKIDSSTGLWDIVIHSQYSIIASSDASGMFANMTNLKEINFANFRVTNLTSNIGGMFYNCTSLKHLDLNHWDLTGLEGAYSLTYNTYTSSVFDPFYNSNAYYNEYVGLFENCTSLETLHIEDWDTSAMINPYTMFRNCSSLKSLDLNKWDTSNFDHISGMFYGCSSLTELKISNWDTSNVRFTNSSGSVIYYSSKIPTDDGNWRVEISHSRAYATGGVFEGCSSLKNIDIANWDTSNMNSTAYMFKDCSSLESIDLSNWNVSSVYAVAFWSDLYHQWYLQLNSNQFGDTAGGSMLSMFEGCSSLKNINLNGWNMIATRSINRMFKNCTSLESINLNSWENMDDLFQAVEVFYGCINLKDVNIGEWNISQLQTTSRMFEGCANLTSINLDNWQTSNLLVASGMFKDCAKLQEIDVNHFDTSSLVYTGWWDIDLSYDDMIIPTGGMFENCVSLTSIDLSNWNTEYLQDAPAMFAGCSSLQSLDLSNWNTKRLNIASEMFSGCTSLAQIIFGSGWQCNTLSRTSSMFKNCSSLTTLFSEGFSTTNLLTHTSEMFYGCSNLKVLDLSGFDLSGLEHYPDMFAGLTSLKGLYTPHASNDTLTAGINAPWIHTSSNSVYPYATINIYTLSTKNDDGTITKSLLTINQLPTNWCSLLGLSKNQVGTIAVTQRTAPLGSEYTDPIILYDSIYGVNGSYTYNETTKLYDVLIYSEILITVPIDASNIFADFENLTTLTLNNLHISKVTTNVSNAFANNPKLASLDLSNSDLSGVTTSSGMLNNLNSLNTFYVPYKQASSNIVGNIQAPWSKMEIDEEQSDETNIVYKQTKNLNYATISSETENSLLVSISVPENWLDLLGLTKEQIKSIKFTSNTTPTYAGVTGSYNIKLADVGLYDYYIGYKPIGVSGLYDVAFDCYYSIYAPINAEGLFKDFTKLTSIDLSNLSFGYTKNFKSLFENCSSLTSIDLSGIKVSTTNYTNFTDFLKGTTSLLTIVSPKLESTYEDVPSVPVIEINNGRKYNSYSVAPSHSSWDRSNNNGNIVQFKQYSFSFYGECTNDGDKGWFITTLTASAYTITYKDKNGEPFSGIFDGTYPTEFNSSSGTITLPTPTRALYIFNGWFRDSNCMYGQIAEFDGTSITQDLVVYANWTPNFNTITWKNWNGDILYSTMVEIGSTPSYTGTTPTRQEDAQYTYTFSGWDPAISQVTDVGETTYTATFTGTLRKYDVYWVVDGTTVETYSNIEYGTVVTYTGATPTKPATAQYTYTFSHWDPNPSSGITGDTTYNAIFTSTTNKYTITWVDGDGNTLQSSKVEYGTTPTYSGAAPTKTATAQYSYNWTGNWDKEITTVTGDATYTATFNPTLRSYTITWKNEDGSTLETDSNVSYGATPEYNGSTPTKAGNAQYSYTFNGWSPAISSVTGNATYTAQFTQSTNKYTITWINEDGSPLETDSNVSYGATPEYNGSTPTKTGNAQYSYTFNGWSPAVSSVTGDTIYTAQFTQSTNKYTVTWNNWDGTTLETDSNVSYGSTPEYNGSTPTKTGDAQYSYTFNGWSPAVSSVTGNITYTAQFIQSTNEYTITWKNGNGSIIKTESLDYGSTPSYSGATPTKTATAKYSYTFNNTWSPNIINVVADATYTAQFDQTINKYTITWKMTNSDGSEIILQSSEVEYDAMPTYNGETPQKTRTAQYTFTFSKWTPEVSIVTGHKTYIAEFTSSVNQYTITWLNDDDSIIDTTTVAYGDTPSHADPTKENTAQYSYSFSGWSPAIAIVTGDATYKATFTSTVNKYIITWKDGNGSTIKTESLDYGSTPSYSGATPTKTATAKYSYTFNNTWSPNIINVVADATYTAQFDQTINKYTITWKMTDSDGSEIILQSSEVEYDAMPTYNRDTPQKTRTAQYTFTFSKWTPEVSIVTGHKTYIAEFTETINTYTVTWKNYQLATLETDTNVQYGTTPTYDGETPRKPSDAEYKYEFKGWDPTVSSVEGDVTYVAQFDSIANSYTITWKNWDGTTLETDKNVPYGATPSYDGDDPYRASTARYTYTWTGGWDKELSAVTGNTTYTATYTSTVNKYTITWKNENGDILQTDEDVEYGSEVKYNGEPPTKDATAQFTYEFEGWSPEVTPVRADATYTATYTATINKYTITWKNEDGTTLEIDEYVEYGTRPVYNGETPTKKLMQTLHIHLKVGRQKFLMYLEMLHTLQHTQLPKLFTKLFGKMKITLLF